MKRWKYIGVFLILVGVLAVFVLKRGWLFEKKMCGCKETIISADFVDCWCYENEMLEMIRERL